MLHHPEPWFVERIDYPHSKVEHGEIFSGPRTLDEEGNVNSLVVVEYKGRPLLADAERIVACVNAMVDIPACDLPEVRAIWLALAGKRSKPLDSVS